jgi:hypothetical protein
MTTSLNKPKYNADTTKTTKTEILIEREYDGIVKNLKEWANHLEVPYTTILTRWARYKKSEILLEDVLAPSKIKRSADRQEQLLITQQEKIAKQKIDDAYIDQLILTLTYQLEYRSPRARLRRLLAIEQTPNWHRKEP